MTYINVLVAPPGQTTVYLVMRDQSGNPASGVIVNFQLTAPPPGVSGDGFSQDIIQRTSALDGTVSIPLPVGATFQYWTKTGQPMTDVVPATGPYALRDLLGSYR